MFDNILQQVFGEFSDLTVYFVMASLGTLLFALKLLITMIGGSSGDLDFDVDVEDGFDLGHSPGFHLFNLLSILCFMMAAGWMGLACRLEWGFSAVVSAAFSGGFGFALMAFSSFGLYQMKKMNQASVYDSRTTIGTSGQVYLRIPAQGEGTGQVQINVGGRQSVLPARTRSDQPLDSFTGVRVVEVTDDGILIVEEIK